MKLQAAFKLSVLATAVAVTSTTFAATGNKDSIASDSSNWNDVVNPAHTATKDKTDYQFVDLNSTKVTGNLIEQPKDSKVSTQLFVDGAQFDKLGNITNYQDLLDKKAKAYVKLGEGDTAEYYAATLQKPVTTGKGQADQHYVVDVNPQKLPKNPSVGDKPALGGLSQQSIYSKTDKENVRVVDGNFLQYGQKETVESGTSTKAGNLTDDVKDGPNLTGNIKNDILSDKQTTVTKDQTITVGNIYKDKANQPGTGLHNDAVHGLQIKDLQNDPKTGKNTVNKTATLTVGELEIKDTILGTSTSVTANGITTTGNVSAATITLAGKDLAQTITEGDAATLKTANDYTDAGLKVATEDRAAIREEYKAADAKITEEYKAADVKITEEYKVADAKITTAFEAADVEIRKDLVASDAAIRKDLADADTANLKLANNYTDTKVAEFNGRVNQLNSRVDEVEKTSYRGIAIALAAQQQIPNIGAGQYAVFGGVGHYEGESAGALGVASVFADGRTSVSAALGVAGGSEIGGRVGVAYVFGGK